MKILTKLLLIHWHYFTHEIIEFDELNFLTGKNSSGKSTIIDAMQLVLLGDTGGSYFNKAASKRGNRTLKGYLLGELGDDEDSGFRYLREGKRFTSYIALEFYDEIKNRHFTTGCCFDIYSENDIPKLFFIYEGEMHPEGFQKSGVPMEITALRMFLREHYNGRFDTTDVGRDYRTKLYGKLGGLRNRFSSLLKKAVSFDPDIDIQQFISDFVCDDQQTVDVSHMQENIRSYKMLEGEAAILHERIALLGQIVNTYDNYVDAKNSELLYSFLIDRAETDMKSFDLRSAKSEAQKLTEQLEDLLSELADMDMRLTGFRQQRDVLHAEYKSDGNAQTLDEIDRQIKEKELRIINLQNEHDKTMGMLGKRIGSWRGSIETMLSKIDMAETELLQASILSQIEDIVKESRGLLESIASVARFDADTITKMGEAGLKGISNEINDVKTRSIELNTRLRDEQDRIGIKRSELQSEQRSLESGIYRFPQDALDLKDAISSRLRSLTKKDVSVRIVAEVSEIDDDRWRNVIEGYLNTQKFYIIVPDEYFRDAMRVFDKIKRDKNVYGTGLIDTEKLRRLNPVADEGSLAEEIKTDDISARLFLDYTLGRVIKCDDVRDLRRFRTSVTDEGVLYQNFVVRALSPERWKKPAIGQGAIERRLKIVKDEIALLTRVASTCSSLKIGLGATSAMEVLGSSEIEDSVINARNMAKVPELTRDLTSLKGDRDAIDKTKINVLKERIAVLENDIDALDKVRDDARERKGTHEEQKRRFFEETIPGLSKQLQEKELALTSSYDESWLQEVGTLRYERELSTRGSADRIASAFPRERTGAKNAKDKAWDNLVDLRRSYNDKFKMGYSIEAPENDDFKEAWTELCENKLPEFQTRIDDAKKRALEQFQEDFISRLHNNIKTANRQIDELNAAIKGAEFGEETFRFRITPEPDKKRYHDMIMDEMITQGGYNLFTLQYNEKYKEEIAELFAMITNEGGGGGSAEYERRVHEFTDFRKYLYFDLETIGRDGVSQRLSKTMRKKSGGETQTPFYIAVLASFVQLYRTGRDSTYKTSRLIIFDEAFSKMDSERIIKSIELLRKFKFQAILSAPPEKIDYIATLVDRNILVYREGAKISVGSFDPKSSYVEKRNEV